jgi:predicted metal-dependent HD superfamily phosphohydrolase
VDDIAGWVSSLPERWTGGCAPEVFAAAREAYASAGRFYHTWEHVLDCLEKLHSFPDSGRAVFLALLFHDAVYVPGRQDNEARSAALASDVLRRHASLEPSELQAVERMILATRDHRLAADARDRDVAVALDIDMSILGAPWERYRRYADDVRSEYCPAVTSARGFAAGRMAFLSGLLRPAPIFHTTEGVARWERPARENIARELGELRAGAGVATRLLARFLGRR